MYERGRAWIELNMHNLRHNIAALRGLLPPECRLMPAVKANAYGHGSVLIAKELNKLGIDAFCVATLQEGIELRAYGIQGDILILGYTSPEEWDALCQYDLMQTIVDYDYAAGLNAYGKKFKVHIKIDTGMHRSGEWYLHTSRLLGIFSLKNLVVDGMYTHLCVADTPSQEEYTKKQIEYFYHAVKELKKHEISLPKLHIQGSYGVLNCPDLHCDYARVGIAMYGVLSNAGDEKKHSVPLYPVLAVKARVEMVKTLSFGERMGYGLQFTADRKMQIAIIAIGYADGIPRQLSCGVGAVIINGRKAPIIGRICMDKLSVDVTGISSVKQGDIATIIGKDGPSTISAYDIASQTASISNEILGRLGARLIRVVKNG